MCNVNKKKLAIGATITYMFSKFKIGCKIM